VRVPLKQGERARRRLSELGLLDPGRRPVERDGSLLLPLVEGAMGAPDIDVENEVVEADLPVREILPRPRSIREAPGLPPELAAEVTRALDIVGDIAVVRLPDALLERAGEVGRALMGLHPRVRVVAVDRGVSGPHRVRSLEPVAGEGPLATVHHENGLQLHVDLAAAYFSPRLATEHRRVADLVRPGERVLDMFAGVGPFAVLIAKDGRAAEVHAVDLNPVAAALLRANATANRTEGRLHVHEGDARAVVPPLGGFDRIIMNHPHHAIEFVDVALGAAKDGTVVHLHAIGRPEEVDAVERRALTAARAARMPSTRTVLRRKVGSFGPGVWHYCLDIVVLG
jgi:tRNA (guanine37-N1)-methyltransferase